MNVFEFDDLDAFFAACVAAMEKERGFSFGRWAQKLGSAQTASLTRVINGQRTPGDTLIASFVGYFGFDAKQAEYFRHLVTLRKSKDAAHDTAIRARMQELRAGAGSEAAALSITQGSLLELTFRADPIAVETALGLDCAREKGLATLTLAIGCYDDSSFGAGQELVLSVAAKPGGLPYAFDVMGSSARFGSYHRLLWGNPWALGQFALTESETGVTCRVSVDGRERAHVALGVDQARGIEEAKDAFGYCRAGKQMERYRFTRKLTGITFVPSELSVHVSAHAGLFDARNLSSVVLWRSLDIALFAPGAAR